MLIARLKTVLIAVLSFICFNLSSLAEAEKPLTLGIHPYLAATDLHTRFKPLANFLRSKLGQQVTIVIAKDFQDQIDGVGQKIIDFAYMGPAPYVKMADTYGEKTILGRFETNGKPTFHGVIFVAKDSPIRGLANLQGKRFAFGDRNSTMSHLVPVYMLWEAGVTVDKLASYEFIGKRENIALGVLSGVFDAGAVNEETFHQYEKRGLRILARTLEISGHVLIANSRFPEKTVSTLRNALYELKNSEEGRAILTSIGAGTTGIVPANDKDYDNLREVLRQLEKHGIQ